MDNTEFQQMLQTATLEDLQTYLKTTEYPILTGSRSVLILDRILELKRESLKDPPKAYQYFLTFTLKDKSLRDKALEWVIGRKDCDFFVSMEYVEELTKEGVPHFHVILTSTKSLEKARFKYYEKYGFVDFKRITPKTLKNVQDYINKVGDSIKL